jgi:2-oxo-4-hydroxy-4-carboxy--5-ureidoimidazoline (OHCU) decarboxylase
MARPTHDLRAAFSEAMLTGNDEDDLGTVTDLAKAYHEHSGFPLVVARGRPERYERVLRSGWSRMENSPTSERSFALIEIAKVADHSVLSGTGR